MWPACSCILWLSAVWHHFTSSWNWCVKQQGIGNLNMSQLRGAKVPLFRVSPCPWLIAVDCLSAVSSSEVACMHHSQWHQEALL